MWYTRVTYFVSTFPISPRRRSKLGWGGMRWDGGVTNLRGECMTSAGVGLRKVKSGEYVIYYDQLLHFWYPAPRKTKDHD